MLSSAQRFMKNKARAATRHRFECQCCSPKRRISGAAVESHHRAAQRRRDEVNRVRASQGKDLLEANVPRPIPVLSTAHRMVAIAAKGKACRS